MSEKARRILETKLVGKVDSENDLFHIGKILLKTLKKFGSRSFQIDAITGKTETFKSVLERSVKCAVWLKENGIKKDDVIMLAASNHLDSVVPLLAALYIGAPLLPVDVNLNIVDLQHTIHMGKPKIIFCDSTKILEVMETAIASTKIYGENKPKIVIFEPYILSDKSHTKFGDITKISECKFDDFSATDLDPVSAPAFIMCTSGTTGQPKGVVLPHRSVVVQHFHSWKIDDYPYTDEIIMLSSSLHWYSGPALTLTSGIFGATKVQSSLPFSADIFYDIFKTYKPTMFLTGPTFMLNYLHQKKYEDTDWSSIKRLICVGSAVGNNLYDTLKKKVVNGHVITSYGATEAVGSITSSLENPMSNKVPVGKRNVLMDIKIVNENGTELGPNQPGEMYIKSEYIFKEYYKQPELTRQSFTPDGWFKTGDILYYDELGFYYFKDRLKSMMKYHNNQIWPAELEEVIQTHPGVNLVVVERFESPPDDLPVALIVRKPGSTVTAQEIKDLVKNSLAVYKQLHGGVAFVETLPYLPSGKIDRKKAREIIKNIKTE